MTGHECPICGSQLSVYMGPGPLKGRKTCKSGFAPCGYLSPPLVVDTIPISDDPDQELRNQARLTIVGQAAKIEILRLPLRAVNMERAGDAALLEASRKEIDRLRSQVETTPGTPLTEIPTDQLLTELELRFDSSVFVAMKTRTDSESQRQFSIRGDPYTCIGLATFAADNQRRDVLSSSP